MNIVGELAVEIVRVRDLLEKLDAGARDNAERTIRFAQLAMQQCSYEDMRESLDDLRAISVGSGS
jgi:hypothetical protein